ncbi:MAG TPA: RNA-binding protein [Bacteroidales bacterium]|nr:RNA-binding protein [Bacteroidales bacterium]
MNIYVAGIPFKASENELKGLFEEYGEVVSAKIIIDKFTQKSRGFGFVEMSNDEEAQQAISSLNGSEFMGKNLIVNEAKPRTENSFNNNRNSGGYGKNPNKRY